MTVIYNVTINSTGKENCFQVTWRNPGVTDCFASVGIGNFPLLC
jgi:hypothetical protein